MESNQPPPIPPVIPPTIEKPPKKSRVGLIIIIIILLLIVGGAVAAWFVYPPLQSAVMNLFSSKPQSEAVIRPEDQTDPIQEPEKFSLETVVGRDQARFRDINLIRIALAGYYDLNENYPEIINALMPDFIKTIPEDPSGVNPYSYDLTAGGYTLTFTLEGDIMDLTSGQHELSPEGYDVIQIKIEPEDTVATPDPEDPAADDSDMDEPVSAVVVPKPEEKPDTDNDGLDDQKEETIGTDPNNPDTDGDGLEDGDEISLYGTNPRLPDTDGDGFNDGDEIDSGFDPRQKDTVLEDSDQDGIYDLIEIGRGYNPSNPDTDGDGLADGDELNVFSTSPVLADTDGDGYSDGQEIADGFNPLGEGDVSTGKQSEWTIKESKYGLHQPTLQTLGR